MHAAIHQRLWLARAHREHDLAQAARARLLRPHRAGPDRPVRARVGRSIIRLGERLAAEPHLEPARPR